MSTEIRTRIAPSPTGNLHVGTARAALFNELYARKHGGKFVVRIEDTDAERSKPEFEERILEGLRWLGLTWDEGPDAGGDLGPYRQSERREIYATAIEQLLSSGKAYQEAGEQAVRLKVADEDVVFEDVVRGTVTTSPKAWGGDFVIARSLEDAVFHLAVVIDDHSHKISHVIRGEDHVSNTARHILLQRALGYETPQYAHLPLLLDEERKKLSKRKGEVDLLAYRDKGFLPEALLNYLAFLGWNPKTEEEFFTHEELITAFELDDVQKGGAIFSVKKLEDVNKHYIKALTNDELLAAVQPYLEASTVVLPEERILPALKSEQERVGTLAAFPEAIAFFAEDWEPSYDPEVLIWRKSDKDTTVELLDALHKRLEAIDSSSYTVENLEQVLIDWLEEDGLGKGDVLWPMRYALSGQQFSPGPFEIAAVLGKEESMRRVLLAYESLKNLN